MRRSNRRIALSLSALAFCLLLSCGSKDSGDDTVASGTGIWARSLSAASADSIFRDVAKDSSGNLYAVGLLYGNGSFTFGNVSVSGAYATGWNAFIVKYDASGTIQWAKSASSGSYWSNFLGVATDSAGNAYAVGTIYKNGSYTFGDISLSGPCSSGMNPFNPVIVKYDPSGKVLWARTVDSVTGGDGYSASQFTGIRIDSSGDLCVVGWIYGTRSYTFGTKTVTGGYEGGDNPFNALLLKLDSSSGDAIWAKSVGSGAPNYSKFSALAIDSSDDIYVSGRQYGNGTFAYGSVKVSESGAYASGTNALIAKYDAAGNAIWARTVVAGPNASTFEDIGVDGPGGVYAAGYHTGNGEYDYGDASVCEPESYSSGSNPVIVKFGASTGSALWARSATAASGDSGFSALAVDASGNAYAAGRLRGNAKLDFGERTVTGSTSEKYMNAFLVKYDSAGNALLAQSVTAGIESSSYYGAFADTSGNLFLVGDQDGDQPYIHGGQSVTGAYNDGSNAVIVKFAQ
jgi:hypothetical protein